MLTALRAKPDYEMIMERRVMRDRLLPNDIRHKLMDEMRFDRRFNMIDTGIYEGFFTSLEVCSSCIEDAESSYDVANHGYTTDIDSLKKYYNSRFRNTTDYHVICIEPMSPMEIDEDFHHTIDMEEAEFTDSIDKYRYSFHIYTINKNDIDDCIAMDRYPIPKRKGREIIDY